MAKILVSDDLSPKGIAILQAAEGLEVDVKTGMATEELIDPLRLGSCGARGVGE